MLAKGAPDQKRNLARAAVYLLLMRDKVPRTYGEKSRPVPRGALHAKRIQLGIAIPLSEDDSPEANALFLLMREDKLHFYNPQEEERISRYRRAGCFALTAEGEVWARALLDEHERGLKPWLMDWHD